MEVHYQLALCFVDKIGPVIARALVDFCGSAEAVFNEKKHLLEKVPGLGNERVQAIFKSDPRVKADLELKYANDHGIEILFYKDEAFPRRLLRCADSPVLLFKKGQANLNPNHTVAVVGTRNQTSHGASMTTEMIREWSAISPTIISGLALGIDATAHRAALKYGCTTIAVLGHGFEYRYPYQNRKLYTEIEENGALLTEFPSTSKPDAANFPKRNRIVAGMSDATVVVEAAIKGGALITGQLAASYNRDVFAVPGRVSDPLSAGCLNLIKKNEACVLSTPSDLLETMGWETESDPKPKQISLPIDLSTEEASIISALQYGPMQVDKIGSATGRPISQVFALITTLELRGLVKSLPGKQYTLL
ncbi:MAG: DNA-protecting protein DprA [Bacteroidetes bacterium]|nr:MAG: DNA-protecting protein DprA [Bacteroidota bacterium]